MCSYDFEEAIKKYRHALMLRPDFPRATCKLPHSLQCVCGWDNREEIFILVEGILRRQIEMSIIPSIQPFQAIAYPLAPILTPDISPNDGTEFGFRIQSEVEHFIDVSSLTLDATTGRINEDRIQILVDLNGYTEGGRSEIFAMQQAEKNKEDWHFLGKQIHGVVVVMRFDCDVFVVNTLAVMYAMGEDGFWDVV
ncbi:putative UDP-N-acetylglucosamine--peptide N-acetylglucosaminyltransferase SEC [Capsicum baccatum]|uniref:UDP-N-acetylglucosamine--peptide N-acetylglucosaminyltransferase SEC n=1 Tax=Capsicum baccatum TaxID=33114 RepID=A0A2G2VYT2_CAPBA|nr:putative UDP-N-acetylglucosamine--peptide N-acetylglucosaminyltransferase SEC [Capsicum baccatum]